MEKQDIIIHQKFLEDQINIGDCGAFTLIDKEKPSWISKLADFQTQPG